MSILRNVHLQLVATLAVNVRGKVFESKDAGYHLTAGLQIMVNGVLLLAPSLWGPIISVVIHYIPGDGRAGVI